jgi:hypothetical protein
LWQLDNLHLTVLGEHHGHCGGTPAAKPEVFHCMSALGIIRGSLLPRVTLCGIRKIDTEEAAIAEMPEAGGTLLIKTLGQHETSVGSGVCRILLYTTRRPPVSKS